MSGFFKRVFDKMEEKIINDETPKFYSETDKPKGKATIVEDEPLSAFDIEENVKTD